MSASRPPGCQGCLPRIIWYPPAMPVWTCRCPPRKPYEPPDFTAVAHLQCSSDMSEDSKRALLDICQAAYRMLEAENAPR